MPREGAPGLAQRRGRWRRSSSPPTPSVAAIRRCRSDFGRRFPVFSGPRRHPTWWSIRPSRPARHRTTSRQGRAAARCEQFLRSSLRRLDSSSCEKDRRICHQCALDWLRRRIYCANGSPQHAGCMDLARHVDARWRRALLQPRRRTGQRIMGTRQKGAALATAATSHHTQHMAPRASCEISDRVSLADSRHSQPTRPHDLHSTGLLSSQAVPGVGPAYTGRLVRAHE